MQRINLLGSYITIKLGDMKKVIIIRGISGAGKSTFIKKNFSFAEICSADHYFINDRGDYNFNPKQIGSAHGACKARFQNAVKTKKPLIVVDNTNTKTWEFLPYIQTAKAHGYEVEVIRLQPDWQTAAKRNVHKVPEDKVKAMHDRMEPFDGETVLTDY